MNADIQMVPMQEKHIPALAQLERLCFSRPVASEQKMRIGRRNHSTLLYISKRDGAFASHCRADAFAARKLRL